MLTRLAEHVLHPYYITPPKIICRLIEYLTGSVPT